MSEDYLIMIFVYFTYAKMIILKKIFMFIRYFYYFWFVIVLSSLFHIHLHTNNEKYSYVGYIEVIKQIIIPFSGCIHVKNDVSMLS